MSDCTEPRGYAWVHADLKYEVPTSLTEFSFYSTQHTFRLYSEHVFGSQKTQSVTRIYCYGRADPRTRNVRRAMSALRGLTALKAASREQLAGGFSLRQETSEPKKSNENRKLPVAREKSRKSF